MKKACLFLLIFAVFIKGMDVNTNSNSHLQEDEGIVLGETEAIQCLQDRIAANNDKEPAPIRRVKRSQSSHHLTPEDLITMKKALRSITGPESGNDVPNLAEQSPENKNPHLQKTQSLPNVSLGK